MEIPIPSCQRLPAPHPIDTLEVTWRVEEGLISLETKEYEDLSVNMAETLRWIGEAQFQLEHYRSCE